MAMHLGISPVVAYCCEIATYFEDAVAVRSGKVKGTLCIDTR